MSEVLLSTWTSNPTTVQSAIFGKLLYGQPVSFRVRVVCGSCLTVRTIWARGKALMEPTCRLVFVACVDLWSLLTIVDTVGVSKVRGENERQKQQKYFVSFFFFLVLGIKLRTLHPSWAISLALWPLIQCFLVLKGSSTWVGGPCYKILAIHFLEGNC